MINPTEQSSPFRSHAHATEPAEGPDAAPAPFVINPGALFTGQANEIAPLYTLAAPSGEVGLRARSAADHLSFMGRGTGSFTDLGAPAPTRPSLSAHLDRPEAREIRDIFSRVGTRRFTESDLADAQAIMDGSSIDAQAAIVTHAMAAAGESYALRSGFDNRTPMETWTQRSLCRDIHAAGAQMLEAAGWTTATVGYEDRGVAHQNLLAVAPDGRVFMMEYGNLTAYPAGTEPLDVLQSFNVDAPEFYFYNAPASPHDAVDVSASVRSAMGLQVDSAVLGRGVLSREVGGVSVGSDGLGNTTVRFQATETLGVDLVRMGGTVNGTGVIARAELADFDLGIGVMHFEGLRGSSVGDRTVTVGDEQALVATSEVSEILYESALASFEHGGELRFVLPSEAGGSILYFPDNWELTAGMSNGRVALSPQLIYENSAGFRLAGGTAFEAGKATILAAYEGADAIPYRHTVFASAEYALEDFTVGLRASHNLRDPIDERRDQELDLYGAWDLSNRLGLGHGRRVALEGALEFESGDSPFPWVDPDSVDSAIYAGVQSSFGNMDAHMGVAHADDRSPTFQLGVTVNSDRLAGLFQP